MHRLLGDMEVLHRFLSGGIGKMSSELADLRLLVISFVSACVARLQKAIFFAGTMNNVHINLINTSSRRSSQPEQRAPRYLTG